MNELIAWIVGILVAVGIAFGVIYYPLIMAILVVIGGAMLVTLIVVMAVKVSVVSLLDKMTLARARRRTNK